LYGCENRSLTLWEEHRLSVFENRVLRRIFGLKRDEVLVEWKRLHNEEIYDLYFAPNTILVIKSGRIRWAGVYKWEGGGRRGAYRVLVGRTEGRRSFGRLRRR